MGELLALLGLLLLAVVVFFAWRRATAAADQPRRSAWEPTAPAGRRIVLDLTDVDPDQPSVRRLVHEAASRVLTADPALDAVEVVDRDGRSLGREHRPDPLPREVAVPDALREPHAPSRRTPSPVERHDVGHPRYVPGPVEEMRHVTLAERLELPRDVRDRIREPDRGADVVRAILESAGREVTADGDLVRTGDVAIAVVDVHGDADRALTRGFLRIQETDAARGVIVRLGYVDPKTIRRREAAASHVRHVGPDALQRMADAAAVGADPLAFVAGPATLS